VRHDGPTVEQRCGGCYSARMIILALLAATA
jgi:hypothetical protein